MGLISKTAMVGASGNVKYYESLGYKFPRKRNKYGQLTIPRGTKIEIKIEDLKPNSTALVEYECDGCKETHTITYSDYTNNNHDGKYYCRECGVKIFNTGESCHLWKDTITQEERENKRFYPEYKDFIKRVLNRDNFTCYCCGKDYGDMEVHHLDGYEWCKDKRTDETNGITLCKNCHKNFHLVYGNGGNTKEQFEEWIGKSSIELNTYNGILPTAKKIYCLEDDKIYNSADEFSKEKDVHSRSVYSCCNHTSGARSVKGFHILWLDEYKNMQLNEKEEWIALCNTKQEKSVVCLNTREVFKKISEAVNKYNHAQTISENCRSINKSSGALNGEKLVWRFYEDYIKMTEKEIESCIEEANKTSLNGGKMVVCTTTGKIFNSANEGGRYYELNNPSSVSYACNGKRKSVKTKNNVRLQWKYIKNLTEEERVKYDIENKLNKLNKGCDN